MVLLSPLGVKLNADRFLSFSIMTTNKTAVIECADLLSQWRQQFLSLTPFF